MAAPSPPSPPTLLHVFRWEASFGFRGPPRAVPPGQHEVELLVAGRGEFHSPDGWLPVTAGDVLWWQPGGVVHARAGSHPYRCLVLLFRVPPEEPRPRFRTAWRPLAAAVAFADEIDAAWRAQGATPLLSAYAWNTLRWRAAAAAAAGATERISPLAVADRHIAGHFADPLTVAGVAAAAGVSPAHLHDLYRRTHGVTPMGRVWDLRLAALCDLLTGGDEPIGCLARRIGCCDAVHLSRRFKARYGLTPREFRRRFRAG